MSLGDSNYKYGSKGSRFNWELKVLQGLELIANLLNNGGESTMTSKAIWTSGQPLTITDSTASGFATGTGYHVIKASEVDTNTTYRVAINGRLFLAEASSNVINMEIKVGSTVLYSEQYGLLATDTGLFASFDLVVSTIGSSGEIYLVCGDPVGPFLTHTFPKDLQTNPIPFSVDLTVDNVIDVTFESTGPDGTVTIVSSSVLKLN